MPKDSATNCIASSISSELIFNEISIKEKYYIPAPEKIIEKINQIKSKGDMIIVMGAGNINNIIKSIIQKIK